MSLHHSFDIELATKFSIEEAILIHHFQHWIMVNFRLNINEHEGLFWTYQTQDWIAVHFPYWSLDQVKRIIKKLEEKKILRKGNFNKTAFDRTIWYALEDQSFLNRIIHSAESHNGSSGIAPPIPDTRNIYLKETPTLTLPQKEGECVCFGKFVKLNKKEHEELVIRYGSKPLENMIAQMNDHFSATGKKPYKDFAAALRNWFRRRQDEKPNSSKPLSHIDEDKALAEKISKMFPAHPNIIIGYNYIEFKMRRPGIPDPHIIFGDDGFQEQVENSMRKMDLKI